MSKGQNSAVQAIGGEIGATHEYERFSEIFAEDVIDHDAGEGQPPGVEGIKQYWRGLGESFPDFKLDVDVLMGDDDYVTLAYRLSGTHQGESRPIRPPRVPQRRRPGAYAHRYGMVLRESGPIDRLDPGGHIRTRRPLLRVATAPGTGSTR